MSLRPFRDLSDPRKTFGAFFPDGCVLWIGGGALGAFATALKIATDGSSDKVSAFLPGTCDAAISLAVNQRMQITFPMLLMASPCYGHWTQYLPRNPGFM
jgi:hypothetical protein